MNTCRININELPDMLIISEVSKILRVAPLTLKRWEKAGRLKPVRINSRGDRRYHKEEILAILNAPHI